jgi:hypothetical protein
MDEAEAKSLRSHAMFDRYVATETDEARENRRRRYAREKLAELEALL